MEKKRGIDIGPTFVLVHAQPISGRKYLYLKDGRVTVDKEWQSTSVPFALQACVRNEQMIQVLSPLCHFYCLYVNLIDI